MAEITGRCDGEHAFGFDFLPAIEADADKDAKKYICRVSLPGIEPKDVEINTMGKMLTIRGERKLVHTTKAIEGPESRNSPGPLFSPFNPLPLVAPKLRTVLGRLGFESSASASAFAWSI